MISFSTFYEQIEKTAVIAYARMNPVTIGHQKLIDVLSNTATRMGAAAILAPSHTQNNIKDPLSFDEKLQLLLPVVPDNVGISREGKTFIRFLQSLMAAGYKSIIQVAGDDRKPEFEAIISQYNGKTDKKGQIPFSFDSYAFESAGQRDPESEDVEGVSASKVRAFALAGDYEAFEAGLHPEISEVLARHTFTAIRERIKT